MGKTEAFKPVKKHPLSEHPYNLRKMVGVGNKIGMVYITQTNWFYMIQCSVSFNSLWSGLQREKEGGRVS